MHSPGIASGPSAAFTILGYLADIAAAVAALAAVVGLYFARRTVALAADGRRRVERERLREHMWRVYRRVSNTYALAANPGVHGTGETWDSMAASLREALTGLEGELPLCAQIPGAKTPTAAVAACEAAGPEIRGMLDKFEREAAEAAAPSLRRSVRPKLTRRALPVAEEARAD